MDFPKYRKIEELSLEFKSLPLKVSFQYGWSFIQKLSSSLGKGLKDVKGLELDDSDLVNLGISLLPVLGESIDKLVNSFQHEEIMRIINQHKSYIKVENENGEMVELNFDYHFSGKPHLLIVLLIKIVEVYYKDFFIQSLSHLGLDKLKDKVSTKKPQK